MRPHQPDFILLGSVAVLLVIGLVTLFSASSVKGETVAGDPAFYLKHQLLYGLLPGLALFLLFYKMDHRILRRLSFLILLFALAMLFLLFLPQFALSLKGATRWIKIGALTFQPAEFFKLGFLIYLASFFASRQGKVSRFFEVGVPFLIILAFVGWLFLSQPAAGTLGVISLTSIVVYFLAGVRLRHLLILVTVVAVAFAAIMLSAPYRRARLEAFLNPSRDPQGSSYQLQQALISIGSGGIWGVGLGHSRQKYNFLPETMSDSIFAIYAEEVGLVGSLLLLSLLCLFTFRGFSVAVSSRENFSRLLSGGITTWLAAQSFINIAANTGLIPLTGIPLPFFSYGGSGLIASLAASGILLNISRYTQ